MYQFKIIKMEDGGFRFDLGGIRMLINGYEVVKGMHSLINPDKAFGYFTFENNVYGISNASGRLSTAEELYEDIVQQYMMFSVKANPPEREMNAITKKSEVVNNPVYRNIA